jgi:hypothetical protein
VYPFLTTDPGIGLGEAGIADGPLEPGGRQAHGGTVTFLDRDQQTLSAVALVITKIIRPQERAWLGRRPAHFDALEAFGGLCLEASDEAFSSVGSCLVEEVDGTRRAKRRISKAV